MTKNPDTKTTTLPAFALRFEADRLPSIEVSPASVAVEVGATAQLTAVARDADSNPLPLPANLEWTSSAPSFASVDANGLVTGVAAGTATITVRDPVTGYSDTSTVTVRGVAEFVELRVRAEGTVNRFFLVFRNIPVPASIPTCVDYVVTDRSSGKISRGLSCATTFLNAADGPLSEQVANGGFYDQIYAVQLKITATLPNGAVDRSISF